MECTDVIADMLTRVRNAIAAKHSVVDVPASKVKKSIAQILQDEGYIRSFATIEDSRQGIIRITLKYVEKNSSITGLKRISKPGYRIYKKYNCIPMVLGGYGISIVSTSKGIMTGRKAKELKVGGELLAFVW